jgi:hypothetical protein
MVDSNRKFNKKVSFKMNDKRPHKNKPWLCKSDKAKDKTKKDLAAFIGKMIKKEMNTVQKKDNNKHKKDDNDNNDAKSIDAFDLSMIDYTDMANLSIKEDAKVSSSEQICRDDEEFTVSSPKSAGEKNDIDIDLY